MCEVIPLLYSNVCTRYHYPFNGQMRTGTGPALVTCNVTHACIYFDNTCHFKCMQCNCSGPKDNVFVYYSNHGAAGLICFPTGRFVSMSSSFLIRWYTFPWCKGSFTIIDIYESVHSIRFLMTPSPKAYSKMFFFVKVIFINSNIHHLHHAFIFHIYVNIIINTTIDIKKIYIYVLLNITQRFIAQH